MNDLPRMRSALREISEDPAEKPGRNEFVPPLLHPPLQSPFCDWKDPESGEWLRTCTIITGDPDELVAQIHPRMPGDPSSATSCRLVMGTCRRKPKRVDGPLACRPDANEEHATGVILVR
jgi:hypothetical protein